MITIVKVYDKQVIGTHREYCGRPGKGQLGLLGNPFWMKDESQRNKCCDDYATWFKTNKPKRIDELVEIAKTQDIELACFCQSPHDVVKKRCHTETIKQYIEQALEKAMQNVYVQVSQMSEPMEYNSVDEPVMTYVNGEWIDARTLTM